MNVSIGVARFPGNNRANDAKRLPEKAVSGMDSRYQGALHFVHC